MQKIDNDNKVSRQHFDRRVRFWIDGIINARQLGAAIRRATAVASRYSPRTELTGAREGELASDLGQSDAGSVAFHRYRNAFLPSRTPTESLAEFWLRRHHSKCPTGAPAVSDLCDHAVRDESARVLLPALATTKEKQATAIDLIILFLPLAWVFV